MKRDVTKIKFYKIILVVLFVLDIYVIYCSVFNIVRPKEDLKPIVLMLGTIVMLMFFITLKKEISKLSKKQINIIAIILCVLFFIGMCVVGNLLSSIPSTDLSSITREINFMLQNGGKFVTEGYYARYTNQTPVTILIYLICKLGLLINISLKYLKNFVIIANSLGMAITAFFAYLSIKKLKNENAGLLTVLFFVVNPIFYLYSSYFYTDTFCMPFAMIAIYFYICFLKEKRIKRLIPLLIVLGITLALGFKIRVVVGICLIAMILNIILKNEHWKNKCISISAMLIGFILGIVLYKVISIPFGVLTNKDLEFPITHWMMYSLNEETGGCFSSSDYALTFNAKNYEEKLNVNIDIIKSRIKDLGISGWLSLLKTKLSITWSNGDYDYLSKLENVEQINKLYEYFVGNKRIFVVYYVQICKIVAMSALLFSIIGEFLKKKESKNAFIFISIFGAFLFYTIWEVAPRYSLTFLPMIILTFSMGIANIEKILSINSIKMYCKNDKKITVNLEKILKKAGITIIILTAFLGIINFRNYAITENTYWDKVVMQVKSNEGKISKIADNVITQTFTADKKFNCIAIKFLKENTKSVTNYYFVLYNSQGKQITKISFDSNSVTDGVYKAFYFKDIKPDGKQEYTIKIYSDDATQNNSIGISSYYGYGNYDIYPNGTLSMNKKELEEDITFKVQNQRVRTYISKKMYILMIISIIIIEIYSFKYIIIKKGQEV